MHDLISLTKVNGTYCSRGCFRVRLKPVFLLKQRRGEKGEAQRGQTLNQRRFLFFFVFYELTLADVWLYHSQSNSQATCAAAQGKPPLLLHMLIHPCFQAPFRRRLKFIWRGVLDSLLVCLWALSQPFWECPACPEKSTATAQPDGFAQRWVSLQCPGSARLPWEKKSHRFPVGF